MTTIISFTVDIDLLERLDEYAKKLKRDRVRSLIMNEAIREYLDNHEKENKSYIEVLKDERKEKNK